MQSTGISPHVHARIAGFLYLIVVVTSVFALYVSSTLLVRGDAAQSAANILASEPLFRLGFVANLIAAAAYVSVVAMLYELFRPVSRALSFVAASFGLVGCAASAMSMAHHFGALAYLTDANHLAAFSAEQVQALARGALRLEGMGGAISLVFFGFYCVLIGGLTFGAAFMPRILGAAMLIAGLGWLSGNLASFLAPGIGSMLTPYLLPISALGELLFTLWLLVMGVNSAKWRAQAGEVA